MANPKSDGRDIWDIAIEDYGGPIGVIVGGALGRRLGGRFKYRAMRPGEIKGDTPSSRDRFERKTPGHKPDKVGKDVGVDIRARGEKLKDTLTGGVFGLGGGAVAGAVHEYVRDPKGFKNRRKK